MIWTVIEFVAIFVECFLIARLIIKYFGLRSKKHYVFVYAGDYF